MCSQYFMGLRLAPTQQQRVVFLEIIADIFQIRPRQCICLPTCSYDNVILTLFHQHVDFMFPPFAPDWRELCDWERVGLLWSCWDLCQFTPFRQLCSVNRLRGAVLGGWAKVSVPQGEGQPCGPRRSPSLSPWQQLNSHFLSLGNLFRADTSRGCEHQGVIILNCQRLNQTLWMAGEAEPFQNSPLGRQ